MRLIDRRWLLAGCALLLAGCERSASEPQLDVLAQSFAGSAWSDPVPLGDVVNSPTANEQGPALSPDGLALYFCSNRSGSGGNDLFVSRRASPDAEWGAPVNLGPVVNSAAGDCGPSLSEDGLQLFFTSARGGVANDIYLATRTDPADDLSWGPPVPLGSAVNTAAFEFSPFVTRRYDDGSAELYFERGDRQTSHLFVVTIDAAGNALGEAAPVAELNSAAAEQHASVRWDGREVFFSSNRIGPAGNWTVFVSTRPSRSHPWSTPQRVAELDGAGTHEIHPSLSRDGRTILFVRGSDIWMATRTPSGR